MSMSLREQLLQAGFGNNKKAKQAEQQAKQAEHQQRQQAKHKPVVDEKKLAAERAHAAKVARDQELNNQRQLAAEKKARWAEIKQLIEQHRIPKIESDDYFNFIDREKVRRMPVDANLRARIIAGQLIIVRCEGKYDLVSPEIAARIGEREPRAVVSLKGNENTPQPDENDPYKEFVVPDDLTW